MRMGDIAMAFPPRKTAFILASTNHGTMIVNRFDYREVRPGEAYGVGLMLLHNSCYEPEEAAFVTTLLDARRRHYGDGVNVLDIGANVGVFTIEWAKHMTGWGIVLAFEAQERIYHALAGNIAINNCFNARAFWVAVASEQGVIGMPLPDYLEPGSFGSLELRQSEHNLGMGQAIDYSEENLVDVTAVTIDSLSLERLDLMKVDVEGMEMDVLEGARGTIDSLHPILVIEELKTERASLKDYLDSFGYTTFGAGMNVVAVHPDDPTIQLLRSR
jgi:FkbM family methyltransferase